MADWLAIELHKVVREIAVHGSKYVFSRETKDEYGEATGKETEIKTITGIYHSTNSFITKNVTDGSVTIKKEQPMILTAFEDGAELQVDDVVIINSSRFKITGKNNVQEKNIICDISLEVVLDGKF